MSDYNFYSESFGVELFKQTLHFSEPIIIGNKSQTVPYFVAHQENVETSLLSKIDDSRIQIELPGIYETGVSVQQAVLQVEKLVDGSRISKKIISVHETLIEANKALGTYTTALQSDGWMNRATYMLKRVTETITQENQQLLPNAFREILTPMERASVNGLHSLEKNLLRLIVSLDTETDGFKPGDLRSDIQTGLLRIWLLHRAEKVDLPASTKSSIPIIINQIAAEINNKHPSYYKLFAKGVDMLLDNKITNIQKLIELMQSLNLRVTTRERISTITSDGVAKGRVGKIRRVAE